MKILFTGPEDRQVASLIGFTGDYEELLDFITTFKDDQSLTEIQELSALSMLSQELEGHFNSFDDVISHLQNVVQERVGFDNKVNNDKPKVQFTESTSMVSDIKDQDSFNEKKDKDFQTSKAPKFEPISKSVHDGEKFNEATL